MMKILIGLVVLLLASSCSENRSDRLTLEDVSDRNWLLESWSYADGGRQSVSELAFTFKLSHTDSQVSGRRNCNDYVGTYQINENKLMFSMSANDNLCGYATELIRIQNIQIDKMNEAELTIELVDNVLTLSNSENESLVFSDKKFPAGSIVSPNGSILSPEVAHITTLYGVPVVPLDNSMSCVLAGVCTDPFVELTDVGAFGRQFPELYAWKPSSKTFTIHEVRYIGDDRNSMQSIIESRSASRKKMVDDFSEDHSIDVFGGVYGAQMNTVQYLGIYGEVPSEYPSCDPSRIAGEEWNTYYVIEIEDSNGSVATYIQDSDAFESWHEGVCGFASEVSPWNGVVPAGTIYPSLRSIFESFR